MARSKYTAGVYLYVIAGAALAFTAWYAVRSLPQDIPDTPRLVATLLAISLSLLMAFIQYTRTYGRFGQKPLSRQIRRRKGESQRAFDKRKAASSLWALCRSFLLLILWGVLSWAAVSLLRIWLPAMPGTAQYVMQFIAYGAAVSLWFLADQFIPR